MLILHITRCKKSHFLSTRSVLAVTQKYAKNALLAGLCPGSRQESARRSPDSLVGWGVDTPPQTSPYSCSTFGDSIVAPALATCTPTQAWCPPLL